MKLLAVGTVAFDSVETPSGKRDRILGGAASYIGLAASVLDTDVSLVSIVGGDFPNEYLTLLREKNININGIEIQKDKKTFFWAGKYHENLNYRDTLATELNVLEDFNPKIPPCSSECEVLLLGNLHPEIQLSVLNQMSKKPRLVILDTMNYWMNLTWDELIHVISKTDVISINEEEAQQLSGEYSLVKAAKKIHLMGPEFIIIKKGEHGAVLFHQDKIFAIPALPLEEVCDPTGAGDSFAGGFAAYLAKTEDFSYENMKRALIMASAIASFTVEKFGIENLLLTTKKMLHERIKDFKELTSFEMNFHNLI